MKKIILLSLVVAVTIGYWGCKKSGDNSSGPAENSLTITESTYPTNEGTNYQYFYSRTDSTGQHSGKRITTYRGMVNILGTPYKIQIDSLNLASLLLVDSAYFRTTDKGVYYYVDTTGFAESITDSSLIALIPYVQFDQELLSYSFALVGGKSWTGFIINLTTLSIKVVEISASVIGTEPMTLNLSTGQVNKDALRLKFTLTIRINITSPSIFTADVWLIPNIGVAKCEGSGALVNFITGLGIDFGDTTAVVQQSLIDYTIK